MSRRDPEGGDVGQEGRPKEQLIHETTEMGVIQGKSKTES